MFSNLDWTACALCVLLARPSSLAEPEPFSELPFGRSTRSKLDGEDMIFCDCANHYRLLLACQLDSQMVLPIFLLVNCDDTGKLGQFMLHRGAGNAVIAAGFHLPGIMKRYAGYLKLQYR